MPAATSPHGVEEKRRAKPIRVEQRFDLRERDAPVDRRERMRKARRFGEDVSPYRAICVYSSFAKEGKSSRESETRCCAGQ
jgi:hypothetical protein